MLTVVLVSAGCGGGGDPVELTVLSHGGTDGERAAFDRAIAEFDDLHDDITVRVETVGEGDYNDELQTRAITGRLPDLIDIDGPLVATYAAEGAILPLDDLLATETVDAALPSLIEQGTWSSQLWALGVFESGLGLYGDRLRLESAGVRVPTGLDDGWSADEFDAALAALALDDPDGLVLDLKRNYGTGEWLTYGFAPLLASAGGGIIDPATGRSVGRLDGDASIAALERLSSWVPYVDPNEDDAAFVEGRVALSWVGHWQYPDYRDALGDDLVLLPLPDLGHGPKSGTGSWAWSIGATTEHPAEAAALIDWLASAAQITDMTEANGAVPGSIDTLASDERFTEGGPLALFAQQLARPCRAGANDGGCVAVPRPSTPDYLLVSATFAGAVDAVLSGEDAATAARTAAATIDAGLSG